MTQATLESSTHHVLVYQKDEIHGFFPQPQGRNSHYSGNYCITSESPRDKLLAVIDDMLEEVDHMPNQYKNQTIPPSFLIHFLDYVDAYNQDTLDHVFLQNLAKTLFTSF